MVPGPRQKWEREGGRSRVGTVWVGVSISRFFLFGTTFCFFHFPRSSWKGKKAPISSGRGVVWRRSGPVRPEKWRKNPAPKMKRDVKNPYSKITNNVKNRKNGKPSLLSLQRIVSAEEGHSHKTRPSRLLIWTPSKMGLSSGSYTFDFLAGKFQENWCVAPIQLG